MHFSRYLSTISFRRIQVGNFPASICILILREKCPNTEFSGLCFPVFGLNTEIYRRFTPYIPVFSPNTGKYGPGKTSYLDTFYVVSMSIRKTAMLVLNLFKVNKKERNYDQFFLQTSFPELVL